MEFDKFLEIRTSICGSESLATEGKMMSSPAIHYNGKVFAFFSRKHKMVFKLGKDYPINAYKIPLTEFNPFKKRKPLTGWYEADGEHLQFWEELTLIALELAKNTGK